MLFMPGMRDLGHTDVALAATQTVLAHFLSERGFLKRL